MEDLTSPVNGYLTSNELIKTGTEKGKGLILWLLKEKKLERVLKADRE